MVAMIAAAAAAAASQIASSAISANAASNAAGAAAAQEQKALDFQKNQWETTQRNINPWITAGQSALGDYQSKVAGYRQPEFDYKLPDFNFSTYSDPGAQYQMEQATRAINNSSLSKGLGGGGALKALMAKNQEMAGTAYQNAFSRYLQKNKQDYGYANDQYDRNLNWQNTDLERTKNISDTGASMASGLGKLGNDAGAQIGASYGNIGASQASGIAGAGNAYSQGVTGLTNTLGKGLGYYMEHQKEINDFFNGQTNNTNNGVADVATQP